jgi:hypothetical protein
MYTWRKAVKYRKHCTLSVIVGLKTPNTVQYVLLLQQTAYTVTGNILRNGDCDYYESLMLPSKMTQAVTFLGFIWKRPVRILTGPSSRGFSWFSPTPQVYAGIALPSSSFPIYYSPTMVPFDLYSLSYWHRRLKSSTKFAPVNIPCVPTPVLHRERVVSFIHSTRGKLPAPRAPGGRRMLARLFASTLPLNESCKLATAILEVWRWNEGLTTALHSSARAWTHSLRYTLVGPHHS